MIIKTIDEEYLNEIKKLYEEEGWNTYLDDDKKLGNAIRNSHIIGLISEGELIGFIRYLTDFEHILYIQDLIIAKKSRRNGGGQMLIESLLGKFSHIRSKILVTDIGDKLSNDFYEKNNFQRLENKNMVSYIK